MDKHQRRTNVRVTNVRVTNVRVTNVREGQTSEWTNVRVDKCQSGQMSESLKTSEWDKGKKNLDFCETLTFCLKFKKDVNFHCFVRQTQF